MHRRWKKDDEQGVSVASLTSKVMSKRWLTSGVFVASLTSKVFFFGCRMWLTSSKGMPIVIYDCILYTILGNYLRKSKLN
ncbi:hypothetical protein F5890DRAFT_1548424 [Lentinula detonsa]|uniref:Transmembrane protein n=1 Tax=Lentinula detonsa TaxID=2804962 RepID=A0AA38PMU4_9AGAR|nr:hypothetical protein F5890DRAFT_1548424 [Lentinula detonsa]